MTDQFYTNREIYEKFTDEVGKLNIALAETNSRFHSYNGLHDRFDDVDTRLVDIGGTVDTFGGQLRSQIKRCDEVQASKGGIKIVESGFLRWAAFVFGATGWGATLYVLLSRGG